MTVADAAHDPSAAAPEHNPTVASPGSRGGARLHPPPRPSAPNARLPLPVKRFAFRLSQDSATTAHQPLVSRGGTTQSA